MCGQLHKLQALLFLLLLPPQVLTFVLLFLLSFSGFLVSDVPVYFRWIQKISFLTYAYAAVAGNEFLHTTYYYLATPGGDKVYVSGAAIWNGEAPPVSVSQINNGLSGAGARMGRGAAYRPTEMPSEGKCSRDALLHQSNGHALCMLQWASTWQSCLVSACSLGASPSWLFMCWRG